jgi:hypothetical protein
VRKVARAGLTRIPHSPEVGVEMDISAVLSGGISGRTRDPELWVEGFAITVVSGGISGHALDLYPFVGE